MMEKFGNGHVYMWIRELKLEDLERCEYFKTILKKIVKKWRDMCLNMCMLLLRNSCHTQSPRFRLLCHCYGGSMPATFVPSSENEKKRWSMKIIASLSFRSPEVRSWILIEHVGGTVIWLASPRGTAPVISR